jgi:hypothetical protein
LLLASSDVVADLRAVDETSAVEGLAVFGLSGEIDHGLAAYACGHLEHEGHGNNVDVGVCLVVSLCNTSRNRDKMPKLTSAVC